MIEKENALADHQTGNNSGVIHSGIYYKPGSLKAINCKKGYDQLIQFCDENAIQYDLCGKIIVATEKKELDSIKTILERIFKIFYFTVFFSPIFKFEVN